MFITRRVQKILQTHKKKGCLEKLVLDSSIMKKTTAELKTKGKKLNSHATYVVNSGQRKDTGVLFGLNYSIHQHALALDVIQVLDGRNYFQSCYGKHSSLHVYCLSLSDSKYMTR